MFFSGSSKRRQFFCIHHPLSELLDWSGQNRKAIALMRPRGLNIETFLTTFSTQQTWITRLREAQDTWKRTLQTTIFKGATAGQQGAADGSSCPGGGETAAGECDPMSAAAVAAAVAAGRSSPTSEHVQSGPIMF